eukprot:gnl/MRDRNA2_/MRDRNA2_188623_c0_seq1.p1 gnl/MRDRNA2_/MRDRNA2_188623_c0~~gnl/MRDRNA2_/MRDRNA2_188623_c0_seq1.p1  ORF type:complete len:403 (-),score=66.12 gnl/MRDRNA2_/MRDRNA2_188623_c0_seq1:28-1146(-)
MCDAVICLDSSLRITDGPGNGISKLRSILLLQSGDLEGRSFLDFVHNRDRNQFTERMAQEAESMDNAELAGAHAQSFHSALRWQLGSPIRVQFFCSTLSDYNGEPMYFLGIREDPVSEMELVHEGEAAHGGERAHDGDAAHDEEAAGGVDAVGPTLIGIPEGMRAPALSSQDFSHLRGYSRQRANSSASSRGCSRSQSRSSRGSARNASRGRNSGFLHVRTRLSNERFVATPIASLENAMRVLLFRTNCDAEAKGARRCCLYHLSVWTLHKAMNRILTACRPCNTSWEPFSSHQCQYCQMLLQEDEQPGTVCCFMETQFEDESEEDEDGVETMAPAMDEEDARDIPRYRHRNLSGVERNSESDSRVASKESL